MRNSWGARLSNQLHRRPPVSPSPFQKKPPHSEIAPPRPSSQPQLTRLPLVFLRPLIFNTSPCVSARGSKHNKSQNPKLFFFFMLYIRFVRSEHPAAGRSGTVSTADIEGSVGNWIEDIGQRPPHLLMKVHFIWVALSTLFRFYMLDIVYDRSQKR